MGVPVLSSDIAAGGVDANAGEHILTAGDPSAYADQATRVLDGYELRMTLSKSARERVLAASIASCRLIPLAEVDVLCMTSSCSVRYRLRMRLFPLLALVASISCSGKESPGSRSAPTKSEPR